MPEFTCLPAKPGSILPPREPVIVVEVVRSLEKFAAIEA